MSRAARLQWRSGRPRFEPESPSQGRTTSW